MKISAEIAELELGPGSAFEFEFEFVIEGGDEEEEERDERKVSNESNSGVVLNGGMCRVLYRGREKMVV